MSIVIIVDIKKALIITLNILSFLPPVVIGVGYSFGGWRGQNLFWIWILLTILQTFFIAWLNVLYNKKEEKNEKEVLPTKLNVRAPVMLASSPLYGITNQRIFESHHLDINLNLKYAGINALYDLQAGECEIAVASDVAIAQFLCDNLDDDLYILPFAKIENHLKILVLEGSKMETVDDLQGKKLARLQSSVHDHFLTTMDISCLRLPMPSVLECYKQLWLNEIHACLLWEPHYIPMKKHGMKYLEKSNSPVYTWFLCLVGKKQFIDNCDNIKDSLLSAMKDATTNCRDHYKQILDDSILYLHSEFTGIDENDLYEYFLESGMPTHRFAVDKTMLNDFKNRVEELAGYESYETAKNRLKSGLWPGFN